MKINMRTNPIDISASGMRAQKLRMELIANNLANADTTSSKESVHRTADGRSYVRHTPFRRQMAVFESVAGGGVRVSQVVDDPSPFRIEHNPDHQHAVPQDSGEADAGNVYMPNVHPVLEMVDMIAASRAYEANLTAVDTAKMLSANALRILA